MRASLFNSRTLPGRGALAALFTLIASLLIVLPATAASLNLSSGKLAIQGYDPVAYFTDKKPVRGDSAITATHKGAVYRFASLEHKKTFEANPAKYAPQYGGYCAFGASQGVKAPIQPDKFSVYKGKLYLNVNAHAQSLWVKDKPGFIKKANAFWAKQ